MILLVTNIEHVQTILDNSPNLFGVGKLKYNTFKQYMPKNVGVSEGCPWKIRRIQNENVLFSDTLHPYSNRYSMIINKFF